jgi:hypothetical protein
MVLPRSISGRHETASLKVDLRECLGSIPVNVDMGFSIAS